LIFPKRRAVEEKDEAITAPGKENIAKDSCPKDADTNVQTNAGIVSLTGEVPNITPSTQASWATR
jgi:osmotically-inducible protein OsmY